MLIVVTYLSERLDGATFLAGLALVNAGGWHLVDCYGDACQRCNKLGDW